eukprot:COSAG01_NODE_19057_length_1033_cov_4.369379_1_plen_116_part_00
MVEQSTSQNRGLPIKSGVAPSTAPKTGYDQLRRLEGPRNDQKPRDYDSTRCVGGQQKRRSRSTLYTVLWPPRGGRLSGWSTRGLGGRGPRLISRDYVARFTNGNAGPIGTGAERF